MEIKYYCPVWGMKHLPINDVLLRIVQAGYSGIEIAIDPDLTDAMAAKHLFKSHNLGFVAQLPYPKTGTYIAMLDSYLSKLERLLQTNPVMVNSHTGRDYFTFEQNLEFIKKAAEMAQVYGIPIAHETHRGRFSFSAAVIEKYLDAVPDIAFTADFSHWCVVGESLLEDQQHIIDRVIPHCIYIHARVGYAQGAQVPGPELPQYTAETQRHLSWWQQIVNYQKQAGRTQMIITPEFGPMPYMQAALAGSNPFDTQFNLNLEMKEILTKNIQL